MPPPTGQPLFATAPDAKHITMHETEDMPRKPFPTLLVMCALAVLAAVPDFNCFENIVPDWVMAVDIPVVIAVGEFFSQS
ncbi:hypothetical protein GB937_008313 [Aspergillus fischeri]|nr:hypothetical protein GB937_008313 [Aspergillus fischeri]